MKSSIVSLKIIKPSSPTPPSLTSHKLSFLDQAFHMSIPIAFFYPKTSNCNYNKLSYELVEKSLSKALTFYYPYAGRLKDGSSNVDCNDMGVELSNVRVHCPMSQIFDHPYTDAEHVVFPVAQPHDHNNKGYLAVAQITHFDCGGIAIGRCLSHKRRLNWTENNAIISEVVNSLEKGKMPFHSNDFDDYLCSSLLSFPLYKTDFGWGCPARVSFATGPFEQVFLPDG